MMKLGPGPQTCAATVAKAKDNEAYQNRFLIDYVLHCIYSTVKEAIDSDRVSLNSSSRIKLTLHQQWKLEITSLVRSIFSRGLLIMNLLL